MVTFHSNYHSCMCVIRGVSFSVTILSHLFLFLLLGSTNSTSDFPPSVKSQLYYFSMPIFSQRSASPSWYTPPPSPNPHLRNLSQYLLFNMLAWLLCILLPPMCRANWYHQWLLQSVNQMPNLHADTMGLNWSAPCFKSVPVPPTDRVYDAFWGLVTQA